MRLWRRHTCRSPWCFSVIQSFVVPRSRIPPPLTSSRLLSSDSQSSAKSFVNDATRVQYYRLHGLILGVEWSHTLPEDHVSETLLYKGFQPISSKVESTNINLRIEVGGPPSSPSRRAEPLGEFGPELHTYREGDDILLIGPSARVDVDTDRRKISACFDAALFDLPNADSVRQTVYHPLIFGLWTLLRGEGYFGLHAAALAMGDRGVLFVAASDSGKTTSAISLVHQGWQQVSDDAVLLRREEGVIRALSFRRDFSLDPEVMLKWPTLQQKEWGRSPSDPSKFRVHLSEVFPDRVAPACIPEIIVVPAISERSTSVITPMPKREALQHVIAQSAVTVAPVRDWVAAHMQVLADLVQQVATYRLELGRDVLEDPGRFSALLQSHLRER